jgi:hypothetical protein
MIKRFLLFAGQQYYPVGGWDDFVSSFETIEEAKKYPIAEIDDWVQIVNLQTGTNYERSNYAHSEWIEYTEESKKDTCLKRGV